MMPVMIPRRERGRRSCALSRIGVEVLEGRILLADGITASGGPPITGAPGVALTNVVVATYTVTDPSGNPGTQWRAKVTWGDNSAPDKNVSPTALPDGSYEFLDSHTYAAAGTYTVTVNIAVPGSHKPNDNTVTTTATIKAQATLSSIAVTPANPSVAKGLTQQFTATGTFSDGSTQNLTNQVTWASATTSVATITTAGLATAVNTGTSTISATLSGITGSTVMTVTPAVLQSIAVTPANPSVAKGLTQQFTATGTFSDNSTQNLTSSVTWASATTSVATITAAGLATAVGTGTSTISATLGGISGSTVLTVTAAALQSIAVTPANPSVAKGLTQQFTATGTFSDNSTQNLTSQVTWASGTTSVATITAAGLATAVGTGTSTISATLGGISGSTVLTVTAAALQSIAVTPANPSVTKGLTQQFTATGTFSDNSTQNLTSSVTWASATTSVATITAAGLATAVGAGTSTISATLGGITGSTVMTVTAAALQSIAVTPANPSVAKGLTQQFTATGTFSDNSTQDLTSSVTWASATTTVATITAAGLATAVGTGTSAISATLNGISGSTVFTVTPAVLQSIAVTPANPSVTKGSTQQFTATGTFSDNSTQNLTSQVTWASATTSVATITAAGLATAVAPGTSTISATLGGISGSTVLTVTAAALQSIAVTPANPSVAKGLTQQFTATGTFSDNSTQNLTSQVTWTSGTTSVATITAAGLATAVATGTSTIGAALNGITGSTVMTVTPAVLQSIAVTPANPSVTKGLTQQFTATGTFSDNSTQNLTSSVTWASATTSVATITAAGLATAVGAGTSTISATLGGITGSTVMTVTAAALQSIAVTPANTSLPAGETEQLTATGTLSDGTTEDLTSQVTWASSNTSWATISAAGLAAAVSPGAVTISATLNGITGTTGLTVTAAVLQSIAVTPANPSVAKGLTQQFTATGTFSDKSTENLTTQVTWASGTTSVATISAAGLATAVGQGTSTISATLSGMTGSTVLTVTGIPTLVPAAVKANSQGGYYQYGTWTTVSGGYGGTYEVADPQTSANANNRWNLTVPAGTYNFYATWVASASNATNAGYSVYDGFTRLNTFQANQQQAPADGQYGGVAWANLGTITVTNGKLTVAMSASGANGDIVANGILLVPSAPSLAIIAGGSSGVSSLSPTAGPMGPLGPALTSGTDQGGGGTNGTSTSTPVVVSSPAAAVAPASPIAVGSTNASASGDSGTPPSTSLVDHALDELGKGHGPKHHGSGLDRLARGRASHGHPSTQHHHPKR
jgi:hypothetical protein